MLYAPYETKFRVWKCGNIKLFPKTKHIKVIHIYITTNTLLKIESGVTSDDMKTEPS